MELTVTKEMLVQHIDYLKQDIRHWESEVNNYQVHLNRTADERDKCILRLGQAEAELQAINLAVQQALVR